MKIIDYIYYRIFSWYRSKNDSVVLSKHTALLILSLLIFFWLLDIYIVIDKIYLFSTFPNWIAIPILFFLFILLRYRYDKTTVQERLLIENRKETVYLKKRNGFLIVFLLVFIIFFPMIIGMFNHGQFLFK